jgi:hypothetical protein
MNIVMTPFLYLCVAGTALADCLIPKLVVPNERITVDTRPAIRWSAVEGATGYAVKVQSRVPEGKLVASFDTTVTGNQFVPPAALADERVKVTMRVAARCADGLGATASDWFLIDATALCQAPSAVRITREHGRDIAEWRATPAAGTYEVRVHSPLDGRVLSMVETREPRALLAGDLPAFALVSVRARCAQVLGETALGFVTN